MQGSRRVPLTLRHSALTFWSIVLVTLGIDQAVKFLVRDRMVEGASIPVVADVFHLTFVRNMGAAFGLFPGKQPVFITTTVVVLFVIAAYWRRSRPHSLPIVVALGLIAGGSIGNAIDRLVLGSVTDFLDFVLIDFPVFNVADSAIFVGVAILIGWLLFVPDPVQEESAAIAEPTPADDVPESEA